tara:strand:+ start:344 stop:1129 length:786 start_codon:yes stop_codon:yes gene_type:complete
MKKFYVIGSNSSKSLSPTIFNYWFRKYKIKAKYSYLELNKKNFDKEVTKILKNKNTKGLNVTIPFKKQIIKHTNKLDKHSTKINAVNCVVVNKIIKGINTDWEGYYRTISKKRNIKNKKVVLFGYGGAALAIHYVLKNKGFKNIVVINRSKKKLMFEKKTSYTQSPKSAKKHLKNAGMIINTTPTNPIKENNKDLVDSNTILSEIVYSPKNTPFLKMFPKNKKLYGISMLLEQAIPCFKQWFGFRPSVDNNLIKLLDGKIK